MQTCIPHSPEPCLLTDQLSLTIFEKGHPRNISSFQIWPAVSEKKIFLRISSCMYSASSPYSPGPCLLTDQNFENSFQKGYTRNIPVKLYQNQTSNFREEDLLKISLCPNSASSLHFPEPCFLMDQNFLNIFENGYWRNIPEKSFQNLTSGSRGEDF